MKTPELFVVYRGNPYVIRRNGSEVYRITEKGTLSRLTQEKEITRVLFHHTVVTEPEALILAYAKPSHAGSENQAKAQPVPRSRVKLKERFLNPFKNGVKVSAFKIAVLTALLVAVLPFIPINWNIVIQSLIVVLAVPAVVFPMVFVIVVLVSLYLLIEWFILKLLRE